MLVLVSELGPKTKIPEKQPLVYLTGGMMKSASSSVIKTAT